MPHSFFWGGGQRVAREFGVQNCRVPRVQLICSLNPVPLKALRRVREAEAPLAYFSG